MKQPDDYRTARITLDWLIGPDEEFPHEPIESTDPEHLPPELVGAYLVG